MFEAENASFLFVKLIRIKYNIFGLIFRHFNQIKDYILNTVIIVKVKIFDESHEKDLENAVNSFLSILEKDIVDIKYNVAISTCGEEQIYCFSAMVVYES